MNVEKIEEILAENLGEGYRIVYDNDQLSATIEWVEWVQLSDDDGDFRIEVTLEDETDKVFAKGTKLRQIWHEDV